MKELSLKDTNSKSKELKEFVQTKSREIEENNNDVFFIIRLPSERIELQTQKVIPLLNDIIMIDK